MRVTHFFVIYINDMRKTKIFYIAANVICSIANGVAKRIFVVASCLSLMLLSACTLLSPQLPSATQGQKLHYLTWQQRQKQLEGIRNWYLQGSLSISYKNKTDIASFTWQRDGQSYDVDIYGPMHLSSTQIKGDNAQAVFWQSSGKKIIAATPEELLRHQLRWDLPLTNLNYWVRAMPAPPLTVSTVSHAVNTSFDEYKHLVRFEQQGWQIAYGGFIAIDGIDLPTKIVLSYPDASFSASQLRLKMVIKHWSLKKG